MKLNLKVSLALFALIVLSIQAQTLQSESESYDVIIIGAGISGISAARKIKAEGYDYLVLQARDRIGGRTKSVEFEGVTLDLGASWFHQFKGNDEHPFKPFVEQYSLQEKVIEGVTEVSRFFDVESGVLIGNDVKSQSRELCKRFYETGRRAGEQSDTPLSCKEAGQEVLDEIETKDPIVQRCTHAFINENENAQASSIEELSAVDYEYDYSESILAEEEDWLPNLGFGNFVIRLAEGLSIELNKEVISIRRVSGKVIVECTDGSVYQCSKILVSLPLGVLKAGTVEFQPSLPIKHQNAIQNLGFGLMNKVLLSFEENFWGPSLWFVMASNHRGKFTQSASFSYNGKNILCTFMTDDFAREMANSTDQQIIDAAVAMMKEIFGDANVNLREGMVTHWQDDPFARGSYTALHVGSSEQDVTNLREPIDDQIWLIGEHVSDVEILGNAHGAYEVGLESAEEVVDSLESSSELGTYFGLVMTIITLLAL